MLGPGSNTIPDAGQNQSHGRSRNNQKISMQRVARLICSAVSFRPPLQGFQDKRQAMESHSSWVAITRLSCSDE